MTRVHWRRFLKGYNSVLCIGEEIIRELIADATASAVDVSRRQFIKLVEEANINCVAGFSPLQGSVCVLPESLRSRSD